MKVKRIKVRVVPFYKLFPSVITVLALCMGITAVRYALDGKFEIAAGLIIIAGIMDGLDGKIARLLKSTSEFGAQLDSLADIVSFGVAPGLVTYLWILHDIPAKGIGWLVVLIYISCAALRLARFNVQEVVGSEKNKTAQYNLVVVKDTSFNEEHKCHNVQNDFKNNSKTIGLSENHLEIMNEVTNNNIRFIENNQINNETLNRTVINKDNKNNKNKHSVGVPMPAAAALCMTPMITSFELMQNYHFKPYMIALYMILIGILMISTAPAFLIKHIGIKHRHIKPILLLSAAITAGLLLEPWLIIPPLSILYLFSIPCMMIKSKK